MSIWRKLAGFEDENKSDTPKPKVNKVKYQIKQKVKESKAMNGINRQKQKHCSQCGSVISNTDKFCGGCGEEIVKNEKSIEIEVSQRKKRKKITNFYLFVGGIILIQIFVYLISPRSHSAGDYFSVLLIGISIIISIGIIHLSLKFYGNHGEETVVNKKIVKAKNINKNNNLNRYKIVLAISLALLIVNYFFNASTNIDFGYHVGSVIRKIIIYSAILAMISALVTLILHKPKTFIFILFSWLFFFAVIVDIGGTMFKVAVTPKINNIMNDIKESKENNYFKIEKKDSREKFDNFIDRKSNELVDSLTEEELLNLVNTNFNDADIDKKIDKILDSLTDEELIKLAGNIDLTNDIGGYENSDNFEQNNNLYRNTEYNFSINFPKGWDMEPDDDIDMLVAARKGNNVIRVAVCRAEEFGYGDNIQTMQDVKFTEWKDRLLDDVKEYFPGTTSINYGEFKINNRPAYWMKFLTTYTKTGGIRLFFSVIHKNIFYRIMMDSPLNEFQLVEAEFMKSISSFDIED